MSFKYGYNSKSAVKCSVGENKFFTKCLMRKKGMHFQVTINLNSLQTFQHNTYLNVTIYIVVSFLQCGCLCSFPLQTRR